MLRVLGLHVEVGAGCGLVRVVVVGMIASYRTHLCYDTNMTHLKRLDACASCLDGLCSSTVSIEDLAVIKIPNPRLRYCSSGCRWNDCQLQNPFMLRH
jgi:hypothetical protein